MHSPIPHQPQVGTFGEASHPNIIAIVSGATNAAWPPSACHPVRLDERDDVHVVPGHRQELLAWSQARGRQPEPST